MKYRVSFWGGPRCGDEAFQIQKPPLHYFIPDGPDIRLQLKSPVEPAPMPFGESHHYELRWRNPQEVVFTYQGIICSPKN